MPLRRSALPAVLALSALVAAATPASAAGGMAPGGSETLSVSLPATWTAQADRLGVSVVDLVQAENGCLRPERTAGDDSCDADGGDLAGQLLATVAAGTLDGGNCEASGPFVSLDLLHPDIQARLTVTDVECLSLELSFPDGDDDNLAQSDSLSFGLRTVAEGADGVAPGSTDTSVGAPARNVGPRGGTTAGGAGQARTGTATTGTATGATGTGTTGSGTTGSAPAGTGTTGTTGSTSGDVLGEQTSAVNVTGESVNVQTESSTSSITAVVLTWGVLFLGLVVLGFLLFRWWIVRRRRAAGSAT